MDRFGQNGLTSLQSVKRGPALTDYQICTSNDVYEVYVCMGIMGHKVTKATWS